MSKKKKYIGCVVEGCPNDCCVEQVAQLEGKRRVCIPGCADHVAAVHSARAQLEKGVPPEQVVAQGHKLELSELRYRDGTEQVAIQRKPAEVYAVKTWRFIDDYDRWMNVTGKLVPLKALSEKELEDAVIQIRRVNIQRKTKRIGWVAELEETALPVRHIYPEDELRVDQEDAYGKLEEFYEEFRTRGILP